MISNKRHLLTAKEAAEYLGISIGSLNRIQKKGLLVPLRTLGGHRRYTREMLDEYINRAQKEWKSEKGE
jgi:excisionase family DNA binding protein